MCQKNTSKHIRSNKDLTLDWGLGIINALISPTVPSLLKWSQTRWVQQVFHTCVWDYEDTAVNSNNTPGAQRMRSSDLADPLTLPLLLCRMFTFVVWREMNGFIAMKFAWWMNRKHSDWWSRNLESSAHLSLIYDEIPAELVTLPCV